ncbi:MAG: type IV conjugative transfer system protein TraE [Nitrosomonas sp.]|uniref:Conjugal transfer pilus assembly protein TraE n=1 Tax=Nitrosomonas aestuarii TaxID=52441 RepID=A0A1I4DNE5_9PROT|nr:type IV conjugative transfer system protein TraE [Nitrosomonas aestuarii]MBX3630302.1 type IV conjugative transfer system protein TraE [Nitrosomonas sp.]SFK93556.1 conjugal transfer pilus assembly protein TraE [Nitrosomonas aestuarii]
MLFKQYQSERDNANSEIRFMRLLVVFLVIVCVVEGILIQKLIDSEKITLVPPEIKQSFWVSRSAVSSEYLEEMAYWYTGLALNVTPLGVDYQNELFLKYGNPAEYGRLQTEMHSRAAFLKRNGASSQFAVNNITPDNINLRVALSGTLYTWVSDKKAGERNATFMIAFKYMNGRLYVSDFKETSHENIFGDPAAGQS